jgi:SAM-dependent methyltransferase
LERLQHQAEAVAHRLPGQITPLRMSMFTLGFARHSFDLIWSEGAIYIIGFEEGLRSFRALLKPGGYLAATELSWLKDDPPREIAAFWEANYPGMKSTAANRAGIQRQGYAETAIFTLPESSWWANYYSPLEKRVARLREKYSDDPAAAGPLDETQLEIDLYRKYSSWYGYVFYVMQKLEA